MTGVNCIGNTLVGPWDVGANGMDYCLNVSHASEINLCNNQLAGATVGNDTCRSPGRVILIAGREREELRGSQFPRRELDGRVGVIVEAAAARAGCCLASSSHAWRKLTLCIRITQSNTLPPASQSKQCQRLVFGEMMQLGISSPSCHGQRQARSLPCEMSFRPCALISRASAGALEARGQRAKNNCAAHYAILVYYQL